MKSFLLSFLLFIFIGLSLADEEYYETSVDDLYQSESSAEESQLSSEGVTDAKDPANDIAPKQKFWLSEYFTGYYSNYTFPSSLKLSRDEILHKAKLHFYNFEINEAFQLFESLITPEQSWLKPRTETYTENERLIMSESYFYLGIIHSSGILNGTVSMEKSNLYLQMSLPHPLAEVVLGYRNHMGISFEQKCEASVQFYKMASDRVVKHLLDDSKYLLFNGEPPPKKINIVSEEGGIYGKGASGTGAQEPDSGILGSVSKEDVVQFYHYNADRGDLQAQAVLGQVYYFGTHNIQQNYDKALYYFRKCTASLSASKPQSRGSEFKVTSGSNGKKKDDPENSSSYQCAVFLGLMYIRGDGVKASNQTAFQYFKRAAEGGSGAALYYLGVMHLKGIVVKKNYDSATKLLIRSAEKGFADAYTQLGMMMYEKGEFDAAFKYFQTASKTTNLIALGMLGKFYERGLGGGAAKKSCFVALTYYKNVAERGDYLRPFLSEAFDLYQKESGTLNLDLSSALENEESMAASLLAPIGLFSNDGVKSQSVWMKRAFAKFLIAAEMGYEQAQANIAWIVEKKGFKVYNEEYSQYFASLWWNRAALQGNVDARVKMGDYYYYGFGVDTDFKLAAQYYQSAESEQSSIAMFNLGYMHEYGLGVEQDFHMSKRYYTKALQTNPECVLPVNLAMGKLKLRYFLHWLQHGGNFWLDSPAIANPTKKSKNSIDDDDDDLDEDDNLVDLLKEDAVLHEDSDNSDEFAEGLESWDDFDSDSELVFLVLLIVVAGFLVWARQPVNQQQGQRRNN